MLEMWKNLLFIIHVPSHILKPEMFQAKTSLEF